MRSLIVVIVAVLFSASSAFAGALEDANAAYDRNDYATAFQLLKPLAEHGDVTAQVRLSEMYGEGKGVAQSDKQFLKWLREAANQDVASQQSAGKAAIAYAQEFLGNIYAHGFGEASQNLAEAANWYRMAAEHGQPSGFLELARMYYYGRGVPQDYAEAAKWYREAAEYGSADGQLQVGVMYREGEGVPQDFVLAHMWLNLAAAHGGHIAADSRKTLETKMSPAQIAEAQRLAREWKLTK
jgi:TPR repeat protein